MTGAKALGRVRPGARQGSSLVGTGRLTPLNETAANERRWLQAIFVSEGVAPMKQKNVILMVVAVGCGLVAAFLTSQMSAKGQIEQEAIQRHFYPQTTWPLDPNAPPPRPWGID